MDKIKNAWKSFTIWFNGAATTIFLGMPMLQDNLPQLQSYISGDFYKHLMGAVIVGNILLRFKTNKSLAEK